MTISEDGPYRIPKKHPQDTLVPLAVRVRPLMPLGPPLLLQEIAKLLDMATYQICKWANLGVISPVSVSCSILFRLIAHLIHLILHYHGNIPEPETLNPKPYTQDWTLSPVVVDLLNQDPNAIRAQKQTPFEKEPCHSVANLIPSHPCFAALSTTLSVAKPESKILNPKP